MKRTDWSSFRSALIGAVVGALIMASVPVFAASGGNFILGQRNNAAGPTRLQSSNAVTTMRLNNGGSAPALELRTGPGVPPMEVNRAAWVKNLNADQVDGRQANQLVRAAHVESGDLNEAAMFAATSAADVLTVQITAPHRGLLLLSGGIDTAAGAGAYDEYTCLIGVDNGAVDGDDPGGHRLRSPGQRQRQ